MADVKVYSTPTCPYCIRAKQFLKDNKVKFEDILYIEGLKDYVIIKTNQGRVITLQTMKSLEEKLPQNLFKRIHRSYIVGLDRIKAVVGNMVEVLEAGKPKHLPVGKNYRDDLLEIIQRNRL